MIKKQPFNLALLFLLLICSYSYAQQPVNSDDKRVDVLQSKLNNTMQHSASWLDNIIDSDESAEDAEARGYAQLSWLPRTADLGEFDAKFKVHFYLPKWNEKLSLILDNEDQDELMLDYEAESIDPDRDASSFNVALQHIKEFNSDYKIKNRLGVSRKQLYARSEIDFIWSFSKFRVGLVPRIDYFAKDGWGPAAKIALDYPLSKSYLSVSASWQNLQNESKSRNKLGIYHVNKIDDKQLLVTGIRYNKNRYDGDKLLDLYYCSARYRNLIYKNWMYFEVEPFIEFRQEKDYRREYGIALSLISYYGH